MANSTQTIDWLKERQLGIGGSDAAAACGISKWRTRLDLYYDKTEPVEANEPTDAMLWGTLKEPLIRQRYSDVTGREVVKPDHAFVSPTHDWRRVNVDGITSDDRLLECKTSRDATDWGDAGTDEIPDEYMCQVQHSLDVIGLAVCDVAVLIGSSDFRIYRVDADWELQATICELEAEFWAMVQNRTPPEPQTLEDACKRWKSSSVAGMIEATPDDVSAWSELLSVNDQIAALEERQAALKLTLQKQIADSEGLQFQGRPIATWKTAKGRTFLNAKRLEKEMPEIVERFTERGAGSRRFLLKKPKGE